MSQRKIPKASFFLVGRCRQCGKHIQVFLNILIKEKPEFGPEEIFEFKQSIPVYLRYQLRIIQDNWNADINTFKYPKPAGTSTPSQFPSTSPLCKSCRVIEELKK